MNKNIVLIGMPGCGKSTLGYMLAKKLSMEFIDVDAYIEKEEKMSISDIFKNGEEYFRKIESKYIEKISALSSQIIATGGGVIKNEKNMLFLKNNSVIIYINRKTDNIINDIDDKIRPLLKNNKEKLYELYNERHPLYQKYCDIEILNNKDIIHIIDEICDILAGRNGGNNENLCDKRTKY